MRNLIWPYVSAFGLAVTLFSNLEGFFKLGRFIRRALSAWNDLIGQFWNAVFSIFEIAIPPILASFLTGLVLFLSLMITALIKPNSIMGDRVENYVGKIYAKAFERDFQRDLEAGARLRNPVDEIKSWGWEYVLFTSTYHILHSSLWYILFMPYQGGLRSFLNPSNLFLICSIFAMLLYHIFIRISTIIKFRFQTNRFEINKLQKRLNLKLPMTHPKNLRVLGPIGAEAGAKTASRLFLRISSVFIILAIVIITGMISKFMESWQLIK